MNSHAPAYRPLLLVASLLASPFANSADNPAAHQHGRAQLQFAIEQDAVFIQLRSPAHSLLGFEHQPHTEAQHQQLTQLKHWAASTTLIDTVDETCRVVETQFHSELGAETGHTHRAGQDPQPTGHSDIDITQSVVCSDLANQAMLTTPLMKRFRTLDTLELQWIGAGGQGGTHLESGQQQFRISR